MGLTSIVALNQVNAVEDAGTWGSLYGNQNVILADLNRDVYNQYQEGFAMPQYVVFDRDMTVLYKSDGVPGKYGAEQLILDLLY